jgi:hypothetical protein
MKKNITQTKKIASELIAPCGMNCALCLAYQRSKNTCPGCRAQDQNKGKYCRQCVIKNCACLQEFKRKIFCYRCSNFPCRRLKQLDKRYRQNYGMSMLANLRDIKEKGVTEFGGNQQIEWECPQCGNILCVHRPQCLFCQEGKNERHKKHLRHE